MAIDPNLSKDLGMAGSGAAAGAAFGPWGAGIGAAAGLGLGLLSNDDSQNQITQQQQEALNQIKAIQVPGLQKAIFDKYVQQGVFSPAMEDTVMQQASQMNNIQVDPRLAQAQMGALQNLQKMGTGGLNPEDMAALNQINRQADAQAQAKQEQILQEMQQRGQGGSGAELSARLIGAQQGADRANEQGMNIGAQANQRALQSLMNAGALGGQMRGQQFSEQAQIAQAQDSINRFNAANRQAVMGQNNQLANNAQLYNLGQMQNIANMNTQLGNSQQLQNNQYQQNQFNNQLSKTGALYNATNNNIGQQQQQQARNDQATAGMMSGAVAAGGAYGQYMQGQKQLNLQQQGLDSYKQAHGITDNGTGEDFSQANGIGGGMPGSG